MVGELSGRNFALRSQRAWLAGAIFLGLSSCVPIGSVGGLPTNVPPAPALHASQPSQEAKAAIEYAYGVKASLPQIIQRLSDALARHPEDGELHEAAGFAAIVKGDHPEAFVHFLHAAADTRSTALPLYLAEAAKAASTASEHIQLMDLSRALSQNHPDALVRDAAAYRFAREARYLGHRQDASSALASLGFVDSWAVVGSFDNDQGKGFDSVLPPERGLRLDEAYPGKTLPIRFRTARVDPTTGSLALDDLMWPNTFSVGLAYAAVFSDEERSVSVRVTTSAAVRVWVNDQQVISDNDVFAESLDNVTVTATLAKGWNRLLVKSANQTGSWKLGVRFTGVNGERLSGLRFGADLVAAAKAGASHYSAAEQPIRLTPHEAPVVRTQLLALREMVRLGYDRRTTLPTDKLLEAGAWNPLALYFAAARLNNKGQVGRAMDLFAHGIHDHPEAGAFLVARGRFYYDKKDWNRAQQDFERAMKLSSKQRAAEEEYVRTLAKRDWPIDRCQQLERSLAKWPDSAFLHNEFGLCKRGLGYNQEAEKEWVRAAELEPGNAFAAAKLVELALDRADFESALRWSRVAQEAVPTSVALLVDEAEIHRRARHPKEAIRILNQATALSPDNPRPYRRLALIAQESNDLKEATRLWQLAHERDPNDTWLTERLAASSSTSKSPEARYIPSPDEIDSILASAQAVRPQSASDVVVLLDDEVDLLQPDGSKNRIVTLIERVVTQTGRDELIQHRLPTVGKVNLRHAYSVSKGGDRQEASSVSSDIIRFRSLEAGSIVVIQYEHHDAPGKFLPREHSMAWSFQQPRRQVELSRWRILIPKEQVLKTFVQGDVAHREEVVGDLVLHIFQADHVPPLPSEDRAGALTDLERKVMVSTVTSWEDFVRWERALLVDAFPPSAQLDVLARHLTDGASTPRQKLAKLLDHVARNIRYQQEYETPIAGAKPHTAPVVVERGYGDCKDKAVLMIQLAKTVGIQLHFALLRTTDKGQLVRDIPFHNQFNHAVVYVPTQAGIEQPLFMDPTTDGLDLDNLRPDDQGALALVVNPFGHGHEFIPIPYQSEDATYERHTILVSRDDDGHWRAIESLENRGSGASNLRHALRTEDGASKTYERIVGMLLPGSNLIKGSAADPQNLFHPLKVDVEADVSNSVVTADSRMRFNVPWIFPLANAAMLTSRTTPLMLGLPATYSLDLTMDLPRGATVRHAPSAFRVDHSCFSFKRTSQTLNQKVSVRSEFRLTCPKIDPSDYPPFRVAVQQALVQMNDHILLEGGVAPKK